ncbi:MAG: Fur family transcriptional regulator [bacterium]|nr:Fur family transcriptional regulator [bacterium]
MKTHAIADMLRETGTKATKARIGLVAALVAERYPLSIKEISRKVKVPNQSTLYRSLRSLVEAGIVREVHLGPDAVRYEMSVGRHHHHHIVCTSCGTVEDIDTCAIEGAVAGIKSKRFSVITDHSLEFFGICKSCA